MRRGPLDSSLPATPVGALLTWGCAASAGLARSVPPPTGSREDDVAGGPVAHLTALAAPDEPLASCAGVHVDSRRGPIHAWGPLDVGVRFVVHPDRTIRTLYPHTVTGGMEVVGDGDPGLRLMKRLPRGLAEGGRWETADG